MSNALILPALSNVVRTTGAMGTNAEAAAYMDGGRI